MFCFITSLRSPLVSRDWPRVCALFERTLVSIFNQTGADFRVIAVCHRPPTLQRAFDDRLEFISASHLPVPDPAIAPFGADFLSMSQDKVRKLIIALRRARELKAAFVMPIDADDLVSRRLVAHVLAHPGADGWFVERGWRYAYGRPWIAAVDRFHLVCGSGNVLSRRWFAFPGKPERERQIEIDWLEQGHTEFVRVFRERGALLRPVPFRAAVYTVMTGENISLIPVGEKPKDRREPLRRLAGYCKRKVLASRKLRLCTSRLRMEFALDQSSP